MTFEEITKIIGLPVNAPEVVEFIENNGYKYPKKDTISNRSVITDRSYWIEHKKLKINILCKTNINNKNYKAVQSDRKGVFYPLVFEIRIYNDQTISEFPNGLNFGMNYEAIVAVMGKPKIELEREHRWNRSLDSNDDILYGINYRLEQKVVSEISIKIKQENVLFEIFDPLKHIKLELKTLKNREFANLMFLRWLIENEYLIVNDANRQILKAIKNNDLSVLEYVHFIDKSYICFEDLVKHQDAVYDYIRSDYYQNFIKLFIEDKDLRENYWTKEAQDILDALSFNDENYQIIKNHLDKIKF